MPKKVGKFWNIEKKNKTININIYGAITKWAWKELGEVSSQAFIKELNNVEKKDLETVAININSPGGSVFEAHAICNALKRYASENNIKTVANIDGAAFSAASYLAMSCSEVKMGIGSLLMIHNASGGVLGSAEEMRNTADLLDKIKDSILDIYTSKSSLSREKISEMMDKTTWMTPEEAFENGFIDKIETYEDNTNNSSTNFSDFDIVNSYENVPQEIIDRIKGAQPQNTGKPEVNIKKPINTGGKTMNYEQFKNDPLELFNQIIQEGREQGVTNERSRIQSLDDLKNIPEGAREIINNAKYVDFKNAGEVALEVLNSETFKANKEMENREEDFQNSGAEKVKNETPTTKGEELDETVLNAATESFENNLK